METNSLKIIDKELMVSKMEQLTPREKANHDRKLNLFETAIHTTQDDLSKYLTEAHRKNSEAALVQIKEWKKIPSTLEDILAKQRIRDQQAQK